MLIPTQGKNRINFHYSETKRIQFLRRYKPQNKIKFTNYPNQQHITSMFTQDKNDFLQSSQFLKLPFRLTLYFHKQLFGLYI